MLKKVRWANYKVLKNIELDFTDSNGVPFNTVVLAGENGTGKTTILDTISDFLSLGTFVPFANIEYSVLDSTYALTKLDEGNFDNGYHKRINISTRTFKDIMSDWYNDRDSINNDAEDIRYYGVAYSCARVGFKTENITTVTSSVLDVSKYDNEKNEDFTSIKQLLVDLDNQDSSEWMRISRGNNPCGIAEFDQKYSKLFKIWIDK